MAELSRTATKELIDSRFNDISTQSGALKKLQEQRGHLLVSDDDDDLKKLESLDKRIKHLNESLQSVQKNVRSDVKALDTKDQPTEGAPSGENGEAIANTAPNDINAEIVEESSPDEEHTGP